MREEKELARDEKVDEELMLQKLGNSYVLSGLNGKVGEITYQFVDVDTWVIERTYIDPGYRGANLGRHLLDLVVEEAREKGRKIIPSCSFALEQFKQNPEFADVWDKTKNDNELADPYSTNSASLSKD